MYSDEEDDYSGSSDESVVGQRYSRWPITYEDHPLGGPTPMEVTSAEDELSDHRENRDTGSPGEDEEYDEDLASHWRGQLLSIIKKRLPKDFSAFKLAKMLEEAIMTECEDEHGEVDVKKYKEVAENVRKRLSYTRTDIVPTLLSKAYQSEDPSIILDHFKSESKNQIKKKRKSGELAKATDSAAASSGNKSVKSKSAAPAGSKSSDGGKRKTPVITIQADDDDDDDVPLSTIKAVRSKPKKKRKISTSTGSGSDSKARSSPPSDSSVARSVSGPAPSMSTGSNPFTPAGSRAVDGSTSSSSASSVSPLPVNVRPLKSPAAPAGGATIMTPPQPTQHKGHIGPGAQAAGAGGHTSMDARKAMQKRREDERLRREADRQRMLKVKAEEQKRMREREEAERRRREEGKRRAEEERRKAIERAREEARQSRSSMCRVVTFDDANAVLEQIRRSGINIYASNLVSNMDREVYYLRYYCAMK